MASSSRPLKPTSPSSTIYASTRPVLLTAADAECQTRSARLDEPNGRCTRTSVGDCGQRKAWTITDGTNGHGRMVLEEKDRPTAAQRSRAVPWPHVSSRHRPAASQLSLRLVAPCYCYRIDGAVIPYVVGCNHCTYVRRHYVRVGSPLTDMTGSAGAGSVKSACCLLRDDVVCAQ